MDRAVDLRTSRSFMCKKWTLLTFAAIGILITIIMASVASKLMNTYVDHYGGHNYDRKALKDAAMAWIWIIYGLSILFHMVGLIGAYKEHYCMSITYSVLITLAALGSITNATKTPYFWFVTVVYFLICGLSYAFVYDLRRIRSLQFSTTGMVIMGGGQPVPTIINMGPAQSYAPTGYSYAPTGQSYAPTGQSYAPTGPTFVANPQYNGQYGQPSAGPAPGTWNSPTYLPPENKINY